VIAVVVPVHPAAAPAHLQAVVVGAVVVEAVVVEEEHIVEMVLFSDPIVVGNMRNVIRVVPGALKQVVHRIAS